MLKEKIIAIIETIDDHELLLFLLVVLEDMTKIVPSI